MWSMLAWPLRPRVMLLFVAAQLGHRCMRPVGADQAQRRPRHLLAAFPPPVTRAHLPSPRIFHLPSVIGYTHLLAAKFLTSWRVAFSPQPARPCGVYPRRSTRAADRVGFQIAGAWLPPGYLGRSWSKNMRHACVALFVSSAALLTTGFAPQEKVKLQQPTSATVAAPDDALIKKRIEYRDAMRQLIDLLQQRSMAGVDDVDGLLAALVALSDAELAVASTKAERLAALEASLKKFKETEEYQKTRMKVGTGRVDEMAKAKAARIHCELRILEESSRDD